MGSRSACGEKRIWGKFCRVAVSTGIPMCIGMGWVWGLCQFPLAYDDCMGIFE